MGERPRRLAVVLAAAAVCVAVGGCQVDRAVAPSGSGSATSAAPGGRASSASAPGGLPTCALSSLPAQATSTVRLIHAGGPFPYPRNDGVVFGNRERHLPQQASGYYREYTVKTPGASTRGTRRIITGGRPPTDPPQYFFTSDHYDSFCLITGAQG